MTCRDIPVNLDMYMVKATWSLVCRKMLKVRLVLCISFKLLMKTKGAADVGLQKNNSCFAANTSAAEQD